MDNTKHDAGGKVLLPVPIWVQSRAVFGGPNDEYRYTLERVWNASLPTILFVLMNASTATHTVNDPTVAKCTRYAEDWGYGTLLIGNTFAYRATDQKRLLTVTDPVGPDNDKHLSEMARRSSMIVFAYGKPPAILRTRGKEVAKMLSDGGRRPLHILKLCKDGTPSHPLYLSGGLKPIPWNNSCFLTGD